MTIGVALCNPRHAAIEQVERGLYGLAHWAFRCRTDVLAPLEAIVDDFGKIGMRHVTETSIVKAA